MPKVQVKPVAVTQREIRRSIDVGPTIAQVSPVAYWYKNGHFENEIEAKGAFRLAFQQGMDGMGKSIQEWMGLNDKEYSDWVKDGLLP